MSISFQCQTASPGTADDIRTPEVFRGMVYSDHDVEVSIEDWFLSLTLPVSGWGYAGIWYSWDGGTQLFSALAAHQGTSSWNAQICWNGGGITDCQWHTGQLPMSCANPFDLANTDWHTFRIHGAHLQNDTSSPTRLNLTIGDVTDTTTGLVVPNQVGGRSRAIIIP